jgi:signal-transduction protein with cAMP-binding, CBS, and nucleotidyltransferase domain
LPTRRNWLLRGRQRDRRPGFRQAVRFFYLIESGKVQARQAGEVTVTEYSILSLGPGESFPIGAVTAGRPSTNAYTAVEDTFCYQLPAEDFMALMATSPEFTSSARSTSPACCSSRASNCNSSSPSAPASSRR